MTITQDEKSPTVSIILVSYNHLDLLKTTLRGLVSHFTEISKEIILVDNDSKEPVVKTVKEDFPQITVLANKRNLGFGAANNRGAQNAKGEFLLFMNSDLVISGNPLPEMIKILRNNEQIGIVGCQLLNKDGSLQPSYFRFPSLFMRILQLSGLKKVLLKISPNSRFENYRTGKQDFVSGAFFMIRRSLFTDISGFDEHYFMYVEDADLGYQVARRGKISILYFSKDIVHLGVNYENGGNPFVLYHMNRGLLLFYKKNYSFSKYAMLVFMSIVVYLIRIIVYVFKKDNLGLKKTYVDLIRFYWNTFTQGDRLDRVHHAIE